MKIKLVKGFEVLDSRGNPTVAAKVVCDCGAEGFAISPSGASTGMYEAHELRDNDATRYMGKGVKNAVENINTEINDLLRDKCVFNQREIDDAMIKLDGRDNKSRLGANAILAVSLAVARAAANCKKMPLYRYFALWAYWGYRFCTQLRNFFETGSKMSAFFSRYSSCFNAASVPLCRFTTDSYATQPCMI